MKNISLLILVFFSCALGFTQERNTDSLQKANDIGKRKSFIAIPTLTYNTSFGVMFGGMASYFYHLNKKDTISPLSSSGLIATYTSNKSWFLILPNTFYFKEDKYRAKLVGGLGSIEFQTFVDWNDVIGELPPGILPPNLDGAFVDFNNVFAFLYAQFIAKVYKDYYVGANLLVSNTKTTFDLPTNPEDDQTLFGFGLTVEKDSRNSQFTPTSGNNGKLVTNHFLERLGSTSNYSNFNFQFNQYYPLKDKNTIMWRLYAQVATGDVPFSGQNVVGRDDLRGYSNGKNRANQVYDAQTEYRHWLNDKWGFVAFGGIATAVNNFGDLSFNNLLPAAGAGIRFAALPKSNINIGIDAAVGKEDWGVYFRIGEAFIR
ncbi:BamA/TamA family outer membrane protein [Namhaeicola litoreus]|uniref:BamA/TamA family outer membrane protein n=1 Tax=Namhaeicola litoreus TaxID=1052145 RepID=A0ABW3Y3C5_9FLAO